MQQRGGGRGGNLVGLLVNKEDVKGEMMLPHVCREPNPAISEEETRLPNQAQLLCLCCYHVMNSISTSRYFILVHS